MAECGECGCTDIASGSWTPDICRRCGAIEGPDDWYYDEDNTERFNPVEYDKKKLKEK
ncbi:MAG: hypothetical protein KAS32_01320 [Candidatus Peribacteraceae bacterium]|nr:hypothetical protein [Candidatus Peribacteraceae bacterium]